MPRAWCRTPYSKARCGCICTCRRPSACTASPAGSPVCKDVPDDPAKGEFCSLCGPNAPGNCGGHGGACTQGIAFFLPTPTSMKSISATTTVTPPRTQLAENTASGDEHHLWFYWVN